MKPIHLKMTSFGPYVDEEIDFRILSDKELFLITGDTGSGKTTIFDAISVALYGETSGNEKSVTSLRSDHVKANELMKVELTFAIKDKIYIVIRVPKQLRKKQRGEGFTEEKGYAELYELIGNEKKLLDTDRDVSNKIREIIGLNAKQFRQIVMIPQGQFRKLLTESSEEREKILKSIFDVHKYQLFQKKLEEESNKIKAKIDEIKRTVDLEIHHIEGKGLEELIEAQSAIDKNYQDILELTEKKVALDRENLLGKGKDLDEQKIELDKISKRIDEVNTINQLFTQLEQAKKRSAFLERDKIQINEDNNLLKRARQAKIIEPIENNLKEWDEALKKYTSQLKEAKDNEVIIIKDLEKNQGIYEVLTTPKEQEKINTSKEKVTTLKLLKPEVINYIAARKNYSIINQKYLEEQKTLERLKTEIDKTTALLDKYLVEKEANQGRLLEKEKAYNSLKELERIKELLRGIEAEKIGLKEGYEGLSRLKNRLNKGVKIYEQRERDYEESYRRFLEGQAYLIAKDLSEGEPCPVCGSTHHVKAHDNREEIPSLELIKKQRELLDQSKAESDKLKREIAIKESEISQISRHIKVRIEEVNRAIGYLNMRRFDEETLIDAIRQVDNRITELTKANVNLDKAVAEFKAYEKTIGHHEAALKDHKKGYERVENEYKKTLEDRGAIVKEGKILKEKVPDEYNTIEKIDADLKKIGKAIDQYETQLESVQNKINKNKNDLAAIKARMNEMNSSIENAKIKQQSLEKTFNQRLVENGFESIKGYENSKLSDEMVSQLENRINEFNKDYAINQNEMDQLLERTKKLEPVEVKGFITKKEEITETILSITKEIERITIVVDHNTKQIEKVKAYLERFNNSLMEHAVIDELNKVSMGARGTKRITFERYILSAFLKDIIEAANARLYKMTNSRYQLYLKNEVEDKRKQGGLDFDVFDYYTNKSRDVKTLSGGEGFKASLSLALGVGDVARAYAGGIAIDTIFIDEGFGTLSTEYLDNAINCLLDLNDKGKFVGIISHVSELKERIDTQLIVEKSKVGSRIKIKI